MSRWTEDNTEGFTADELAVMNAAQDALEAAYPSVDDCNISDMLNNAYRPGISSGQLVEAVSARLG